MQPVRYQLPDLNAEAERRYLEVAARRDAIKEFWEELGSPLLAHGSAGQEAEHPLIKMLREHEALLEKLALPLQKRHRGPEPSAVVAASIGRSPAVKLRRVG